MEEKSVQPSYRSSRVRRWVAYLWREGIRESRRPVAPAFAKPNPAKWDDARVTAAWLGHATVIINFFGIKILTDPVLFPRIGVRLPGFTIGPKRLTAPALEFDELPAIDLILLSHAHFDHFDTRTLHRLSRRRSKLARRGERRPEADFADSTKVITASRTSNLLRWTKFRDVTELRWGECKSVETSVGKIDIIAFRVKHWGARMQHDDYRGYNGYLLGRNGHRILFAGDTAMTDDFQQLRSYGSIDLAIMSIGCYNPWIRSHCNPEQAVQMANDAGAQFVMPVHHQTFRLSFEPFREPIERFEAALRDQPERIALRKIGETFVLPL
jgi:L-ascorbate metabolism protein UlaG (beta-lactamase superfamily)